MNKPKPDIEETFRQLFDGHEMPVGDADWAAISKRVRNKRRMAWFWYIPAALLLGIGLSQWLGTSNLATNNAAPRKADIASGESRNPAATNPASATTADKAQLPEGKSPHSENRREKLPGTTGQSGNATETVSHEYSRSGSGAEGSNSQPVTNESSETEWEFLSLPVRRIQILQRYLKPAKAEKITWNSGIPIRDLYARVQKPYFAFGSVSGFNSTFMQSTPSGNDWQGKGLETNGSRPGFFGGIQALYAIPVGKSYLQTGILAGADLTPRRTSWNYNTRIVADSFPYRNIPGDTLFWVPVRYRDTQMQVQTEIRMRSISIPLQWTRTIALNPKSGIVLLGGLRLERWSLISGTGVNPQNDRTFSQQQFYGGVYGSTAPLTQASVSRWQGSGNIGLGAYRRLNDHWVLQGLWNTGTQLLGTKPAQNQVGMRQNFGYLHMQMLFTW